MAKGKQRKAKRILFLSDDQSEYIFENKEDKKAEEVETELDILEKLYLEKKEKSHKLTKEVYEQDIEEL